MDKDANIVIAIDPGRLKCGVAVVKKTDANCEVLYKHVEDTKETPQLIAELLSEYCAENIIIGNGTTSTQMLKEIKCAASAHIEVVDEEYTTILAKKRYFIENPPKGFKKLVPISLQTPPCPYDDYVAIILAERYLEK